MLVTAAGEAGGTGRRCALAVSVVFCLRFVGSTVVRVFSPSFVVKFDGFRFRRSSCVVCVISAAACVNIMGKQACL